MLDLREEEDADEAFLKAAFVACSPLRDILPSLVLIQQADMQLRSHRLKHPDAMSRIVTRDDVPIGRIVIDWSLTDSVQGVDIAVLPAERSTGAGLAMMRAWVHVADVQQRPSRLSVLRDNPAARVYRHLGFRPIWSDDGDSPLLEMIRPPRDITTT